MNSGFVFADGDPMVIIRFEAVLKTGEKISGYNWGSYEMLRDSSKSMRNLNYFDRGSEKYYWYWKNRYRYARGRKEAAYVLMDKDSFERKKIRSIRICCGKFKMYEVLNTELDSTALRWMRVPAVKIIEAESFLCLYTFMIHEEDPQLMKLLYLFRKKAEQDSESSNKDPWNDEECQALLEKIMRFKVIALCFCSC